MCFEHVPMVRFEFETTNISGALQNQGLHPQSCKVWCRILIKSWPIMKSDLEVIGRKTYYKVKGQDLKSLRSLMKSGPITKSMGVFGYQIVWFWDDSDFFALNIGVNCVLKMAVQPWFCNKNRACRGLYLWFCKVLHHPLGVRPQLYTYKITGH